MQSIIAIRNDDRIIDVRLTTLVHSVINCSTSISHATLGAI